MVKPKLAIEARTIVRDHSTPRERERPNLSLERRLQLAWGAACEIDALVERIRAEEICSFDEDVAINAFLDRIELVADALMDVAVPGDDKDHDAATLERVLRFASPPD